MLGLEHKPCDEIADVGKAGKRKDYESKWIMLHGNLVTRRNDDCALLQSLFSGRAWYKPGICRCVHGVERMDWGAGMD